MKHVSVLDQLEDILGPIGDYNPFMDKARHMCMVRQKQYGLSLRPNQNIMELEQNIAIVAHFEKKKLEEENYEYKDK